MTTKQKRKHSDTHTYTLEGVANGTVALMRHGYDILYFQLERPRFEPKNTNHEAEDEEIEDVLYFLEACLEGMSCKDYTQNRARLLAKNPGYIPEDDES